MIKIKLICVGNLKEKYLTEAENEYKKRLGRFCEINITEISEGRKSEKENIETESSEILKKCSGYVVLLDINGKTFSSEEFAENIQKISNTGNSEITFIIGGSNGVNKAIKEKSNQLISFSSLTFPHQLMRIIFLEQLYRGFTILNNMPYHK